MNAASVSSAPVSPLGALQPTETTFSGRADQGVAGVVLKVV